MVEPWCYNDTMNALFSFLDNIPTPYFYFGGIFLLYLMYQRYDQNTRYNQKSASIEAPVTPARSPAPKTQAKSVTTNTKNTIHLNEQMVQFLKSYGAVEDSWASWGLKKLFPEELLEDLREKALKGDLKPGMKIEISDGKWRILEK